MQQINSKKLRRGLGIASIALAGYLTLQALIGCGGGGGPGPGPGKDTEAPATITTLSGFPQDIGEVILRWNEPSDNSGVIEGHRVYSGKYTNLDPNDPSHAVYLAEITTGLPTPAGAGTNLEMIITGQPAGIRRFFYVAAYDKVGNLANYAMIEVIAGGLPPIPGEYWGLVGASVADGTPVHGVDELNNYPIDTKKVVSTPYGDLHFGAAKSDYYIVSFENWENGNPIKINCYVANTGAATTLVSDSTELNLTSGIKALAELGIVPKEMSPALKWYLELSQEQKQQLLNNK